MRGVSGSSTIGITSLKSFASHGLCNPERITASEALSNIPTMTDSLLALLQSTTPVERDRFVSHLYQSRREYRRICKTSGKSGKQIERCVIASSRIAESMGFKGEFRQSEDPCGSEMTVPAFAIQSRCRGSRRHHTVPPPLAKSCLI